MINTKNNINFIQAFVDQATATLWWLFTIIAVDCLCAPFNKGVLYVRFISWGPAWIALVLISSVIGGALMRYYFPHALYLKCKH